ncbi:hypothetical protein DFQ28_003588 [Apophysomyces sp. BC1034]|nr:hypothetical protein DFQ30_003529 [Apophysomyces sp. BC1015]KAG0179025.1 hypothetical protein DFQ29_002705 [Apophysomyces sp. BC1021]KAG0189296.1 hypothetical protein DFQ28_003588 [Apophysomyces sp. BC1034]
MALSRLITAKYFINPSRFLAPAYRTYTSSTKRYSKDHEWVSVDKDTATVGVTDYAQRHLGDIVFVETTTVGLTVKKGDPIGCIESVKAASDIYTPVSGDVINVNQQLTEYTSLINESPEDAAWLAKIKISNPEELDELMNEAQYASHCAIQTDKK